MSEVKKPTNLENLERNRKRLSFKFSYFVNWVMNRKPKVKYLGEKFPN